MYFPYFRGRQYELLALRELAQKGLLGKSIIPIIEPVKATTTFDQTLKTYKETNTQVAVIFNPAVGDFAGVDFIEYFLQKKNDINAITPALLLNKDTQAVLQKLINLNVTKSNIIAIIDNKDFIEMYQSVFDGSFPQYTLIPDERQFRRTVQQGKVLFRDRFNIQDRNADYPEDEPFSDDNLYYSEEGYEGFGDYSIIGNQYNEKGFAPYAVAIHIVYFDKKGDLRIHHFISDTNYDISDIAGKFKEAIFKLKKWYYDGQERQNTKGLSILLDHADSGYFPGLPTIKKLSIMHHVELVDKSLGTGQKE